MSIYCFKGGNMPKKQIRVAICYDFDGTLSPHNMQDYDFMKYTNQNSKKFWKSANDFAKLHKSDPVCIVW